MRYHCSTFGKLHQNTFWVCTACQFSPLIWVLTLKGALHLSFCIQIKKQHFGPFGILYTFWLAEFYTFLRGKKECKHMIHSMHDCFDRQIPQKSWSISSGAPPTIRYLKVVCEKSYFQLEMSKLQETKASNQSGSWCIWCGLRKYGMALSEDLQTSWSHWEKLPRASSPHTAPYLHLRTSIRNR